MLIPESCDANNFEEDTQVVLYSDVSDMIDDIVYEVSQALDRIECISGIENIEECANILRALKHELQ